MRDHATAHRRKPQQQAACKALSSNLAGMQSNPHTICITCLSPYVKTSDSPYFMAFEGKQQILATLLQHLEFSLQHVRRQSDPAHLSSVVILGLAKGDQGCRLVATLACSKEDSLRENAPEHYTKHSKMMALKLKTYGMQWLHHAP